MIRHLKLNLSLNLSLSCSHSHTLRFSLNLVLRTPYLITNYSNLHILSLPVELSTQGNNTPSSGLLSTRYNIILCKYPRSYEIGPSLRLLLLIRLKYFSVLSRLFSMGIALLNSPEEIERFGGLTRLGDAEPRRKNAVLRRVVR